MSTQQTGNAVKAAQPNAHRYDHGEPNACITAEDRREMIALGAYYRAQARGFAPGRDIDDWFEAECEVDDALGSGDPSESA